mmetsp:Transcript_8902/g.27287  ORF Transcript_8902/g.27287 Transcript_8902/m.27287 type:complete len:89 (+) Transcript_8902:142-408(+)
MRVRMTGLPRGSLLLERVCSLLDDLLCVASPQPISRLDDLLCVASQQPISRPFLAGCYQAVPEHVELQGRGARQEADDILATTPLLSQ